MSQNWRVFSFAEIDARVGPQTGRVEARLENGDFASALHYTWVVMKSAFRLSSLSVGNFQA